MKKHTKYSHYRPMIFAGFVAGVIVSILLGLSLWTYSVLNEEKAPEEVKQPVAELSDEVPAEVAKINNKSIELFFGGRRVLPNHKFVALYGNPEYSTLGALGEQPSQETYARIKTLADEYQALTTDKVIPTLELITTIASAGPTADDDYSQEIEPEKINAWVDDAVKNEIYVVLDLQPGRNSFLEQAKAYESVLKHPNVGLALDPEWRLQTLEDRHLKKVGSVSADEINQTSAWLAELVKLNNLPQKIFIVHQFKTEMISNRENLNTSREELAYILHMDGHGSLGQKIDTWNKLKTNLPTNMHMAWKNFYDEDTPTPTPQQTMQQTPQPVFISYQ